MLAQDIADFVFSLQHLEHLPPVLMPRHILPSAVVQALASWPVHVRIRRSFAALTSNNLVRRTLATSWLIVLR